MADSAPTNNTPNGTQPQPPTIISHFNAQSDLTLVNLLPGLRSIREQVNSMLQQDGQNVTHIFFTVLTAVNDNLANPYSNFSMQLNDYNLRQSRPSSRFPENGRIGLTICIQRPPSEDPPSEDEPSLAPPYSSAYGAYQ